MIAALSGAGGLRVWSVIVTIFGDSVRPRGGTAPAAALGRIADRIGIRTGALRVALHRLVRDGWTERSRDGRQSYYRLSPGGMARFAAAGQRIYAPAPALTGPWRLAVAGALPPAGREAAAPAMAAAGYFPLAPGVWLGDAGAGDAAPGVAVLEGAVRAVPDWLREALGPPALAADYRRLAAVLEAIRDGLGGAGPDPLDAVALRTLAIHQWRRLLLRHPDLPPEFFPAGWPGEACRALVLELHRRLSPEADRWLDAALGPQLA